MTDSMYNRCLIGDVREVLPTLAAGSVHCCVTSPPYWALRDYGTAAQIGLEPTPDAYVAELVAVFREVRRVLRDDGTLWLNLGDSYVGGPGGGIGKNSAVVDRSAGNVGVHEPKINKAKTAGLPPKNLVGIPWRVAFALQADGWWLRSEIIWHKPNPMPESVTDRPVKAHEQIFLLSKSDRYFYNAEAIREPAAYAGRAFSPGIATKAELYDPQLQRTSACLQRARVNAEHRSARDVWTIPSEPYDGAHFACWPSALVTRCILAGCPEGGVVFDPFFGSGTTGQVAEQLGRRWLGCEINPAYATLWRQRTQQTGLMFADDGGD